MLLQGSIARQNFLFWHLRVPGLESSWFLHQSAETLFRKLRRLRSSWFFRQSVGRMVVCYLPTNLFDDRSWAGFCIFVSVRWRPCDNNDVNSKNPMLYVSLHTHGSGTRHIETIPIPIANSYPDGAVLFYHLCSPNVFQTRFKSMLGSKRSVFDQSHRCGC